jgi:GGDEF domain-containing protein
MRIFDRMPAGGLEDREMQLIVLACFAIIVLAVGLALFMYPVVFSQSDASHSRTMPIAFFGFCGLSVLLAVYLLERQITIGRLRYQIMQERKMASEALKQATVEFLEALPNFGSFQDQLSMAYRRVVATKQNLSVVVVTTKLGKAVSETAFSISFPGDAAKAISRKLREQDSVYILASGVFGIILPGLNVLGAKRVSARLAEGLSDAAGVNNRFSFKIESISYPEQSSSAHDLELAVQNLFTEDAVTREALVS